MPDDTSPELPTTRTVIDPLTVPPMAWANGGGTTREIASSPLGATFSDFDWRMSVADIVESGPFSRVPGVDRHFLMASEGSVVLTVDGRERQMNFGSAAAFKGEADVTVNVLKGPTRNLNLMTRRDRCRGSITLDRLNGQSAVGAGLGPKAILVLSGGVIFEDGSEVRPLQILIPGQHEYVSGRNALIASVHVALHGGVPKVPWDE